MTDKSVRIEIDHDTQAVSLWAAALQTVPFMAKFQIADLKVHGDRTSIIMDVEEEMYAYFLAAVNNDASLVPSTIATALDAEAHDIIVNTGREQQ